MIKNHELPPNDALSYMALTSFAWRHFIKYGKDNPDKAGKDKIDLACIRLFARLEQSDRDLLEFYGVRNETNSYILSGYAYETGQSSREINTRFRWLCYKLAVEAGLINPFAWIEPPQHYTPPPTPKKKGNDENEYE